MKEFELYCETENLPLAETLSKAIGSLEEYEKENENMFWPDLPSYVAEKIDDYLEDQQQRKKQENQQKKFSDFWITFRGEKCGTPYSDMYILPFENVIACRCGEGYMPKCLECGNRLIFDSDKEAFACRKCNVIFKLPIITCHYTFLREPQTSARMIHANEFPLASGGLA